jgi:hypothetical protein
MLGFIGAGGLSFSASAEPDCRDYFYNADGSWSPRYIIVITGRTSQIILEPQDKLHGAMRGLAGRIGAYLDRSCPSEAPSARQKIPLWP